MTAQIASVIDHALKPRGVAVMLEAVHQCMSLRGINKRNVVTITNQFTGEFRSNPRDAAALHGFGPIAIGRIFALTQQN